MANEYGFHQDKAIYLLSDMAGDIAELVKDEILDDLYPVGAIYISADPDFDPNDDLVGEWEQIKDRFLLADGDKYHVGDADGGEETVLLTAETAGVGKHGHGDNIAFKLPNHVHTQANSTVQWWRNRVANNVNGHFITQEKGKNMPADSWQVHLNNSNDGGGHQTTTNPKTLVACTRVSGTKVSENTGQSATKRHNNMPPYTIVKIWKRVA